MIPSGVIGCGFPPSIVLHVEPHAVARLAPGEQDPLAVRRTSRRLLRAEARERQAPCGRRSRSEADGRGSSGNGRIESAHLPSGERASAFPSPSRTTGESVGLAQVDRVVRAARLPFLVEEEQSDRRPTCRPRTSSRETTYRARACRPGACRGSRRAGSRGSGGPCPLARCRGASAPRARASRRAAAPRASRHRASGSRRPPWP